MRHKLRKVGLLRQPQCRESSVTNFEKNPASNIWKGNVYIRHSDFDAGVFFLSGRVGHVSQTYNETLSARSTYVTNFFRPIFDYE